MLLSVAVCTYRRFDWLRQCLNALQEQTSPMSSFCIFVIDNSLEPTTSKHFSRSYDTQENLKYVITPKSGLSYARNLALSYCQTPFIAYIDDDAIASHTWTRDVIEAFLRHPDAGVIGGRVYPIWEQPPPDWLTGDLLNNLAILDWGDQELPITDANWLVGANLAYRTRLLRSVNGFDDSLGRKAESLFAHEELATNNAVRRLGYKAIYTPKVEVRHLVQKERVTKQWFCRNSVWEGASRIIYEKKVSNLDLDGLSDRLKNQFDHFLQKTSLPDTAAALGSILREFNQVGRDTCEAFLREQPNLTHSADLPTIYVVTPTLNMRSTIDNTIKSVASQSGPFRIRYHIQDGGSTDGTIDILRYWEDIFNQTADAAFCEKVDFTWGSSIDRGMYDAIVKAFDQLNPEPYDIMTWINGDDIFEPDAFSSVLRIFEKIPTVHWIGGSARVVDEAGRILDEHDRPTPTEVIRAGLCDGRHWYHLQQEGTFFRHSLWFKAKHVLKEFCFAGDWRLWTEFARHTHFYYFDCALAAFRKRPNQLSIDRHAEYIQEVEDTIPLTSRATKFNDLFASRKELKSFEVKFYGPIPTSQPVIENRSVHHRFEQLRNRLESLMTSPTADN